MIYYISQSKNFNLFQNPTVTCNILTSLSTETHEVKPHHSEGGLIK